MEDTRNAPSKRTVQGKPTVILDAIITCIFTQSAAMQAIGSTVLPNIYVQYDNDMCLMRYTHPQEVQAYRGSVCHLDGTPW